MKLSIKSALFGALAAFFLLLVIYQTGLLNTVEKKASDLFSGKKQMTLIFTGDMMFDRGVRSTIRSKGFDAVFGDSKKIFNGAGLVIANLEGPITTSPSKILLPDGTTSAELNFTFQPETAKALKEHGVDIVNLANNHTSNQGADGLAQTRKYLSDAGVGYFGNPGNRQSELSTTTCKNDICVSLIGWHQFANTPASDISDEIRRLKTKSDIVVVLPHWGVEYEKQPTQGQRDIAHSWIDAGADVILGTHPHIIESIEEYKEHATFYSLGNYIFDQYFSFDTTHGLVVALTATKEITKENSSVKFKFDLKPINNVGTVVSIPNASTTASILKDLSRISEKFLKSISPKDISSGSFELD